jgi:hypothetical protein
MYICALSPGPLRRMQFSKAYTLHRVYSAGYQTVAKFPRHGKFLLPFLPNCTQVLRPLTDLLRGEEGGQKRWSRPHRHRRHSRMQNTSWQQLYPSNIPHQMKTFLLTLTPLILILEGSCSKNLAATDNPLVSFLTSWLTRSPATAFLTANCWQLSPQFGIFAISVKDALSNFGLITNHL